MADSGLPAGRVLRIVLADDHAVVREGVKALVNAQPSMCVVGEASDGEAAFEAVRDHLPDVVVLDLSMPRGGGIEAAGRIRREFPDVKLVALTVHEEREYVTQLLRAGVSAYVLKRAVADELVRALRIVAEGGRYIDPSVTESIVAAMETSTEARAEHQKLSTRERQVLERVAQGFSNKEIAAELELSVKTVETYKSRVVEKLGLRGRVDIVRYAAAQGWLASSE